MEKMMDRCGLFGMFDNNGFHTSHLIYYGLFSMQHRGMVPKDSCGRRTEDSAYWLE